MIAWSIEAALQSECFDKVIVSTDDEEIADVARQYGASVPFLRPKELSDDYTGTIPVIRHAIEWCTAHGFDAQLVCCLYATAPFVSPEDLRRGLAILEQAGAQYAFSVTSYAFPIQRAIRLTEAGHVEMFNAEYFNTRSQDLEESFHDAGQFYWGLANAWLQGKMIFSQESRAVHLPRHRVQDIDTPEDWIRAEWLYKAFQAESSAQAKP